MPLLPLMLVMNVITILLNVLIMSLIALLLLLRAPWPTAAVATLRVGNSILIIVPFIMVESVVILNKSSVNEPASQRARAGETAMNLNMLMTNELALQ